MFICWRSRRVGHSPEILRLPTPATIALGYTGDTLRQKFTGYERDGETGLDFAQARYHSSTLGRFTSPDPFGGSMHTADPQSFNRYVYVGNNPLNAIDPTGLSMQSPTAGSLPGANGALGRVRPGECPPTEWKGNPSQHWTMASGGSGAVVSVPQAETAPTAITESVALAGLEEIVEPDDPQNASGTQQENKLPSCTLQVRGRHGAKLSRGNPLRFPFGIKKLGATSNRFNWGWAVEVKGTVSDDVSTWTFSQLVVDTSTFTYRSVLDGSLQTTSSTTTITENLGAYQSQP